MTVLVETAPHEFAANFLFAEHGLNPFFATDRRVKDGGGSQRGEFDLFGDEWLVTLYKRSRPSASGLDPEGEGRKPD